MFGPTPTFSLGSLLAAAGWFALLFGLFVKPARRLAWPAAQLVIPAILAVTYNLLLWQGRDAFAAGGFGSIAEVRALFANDSALAAGWLHYLAFDLFIGTWIAREGTRRGVPVLLILPCLPLTFLFGPMGLLLYLLLSLIFRNANTESPQ